MATTSSLGPLFTAGGLASGLDTNSIVDSLTQIVSAPILQLQGEQSGLKTQVSTLGDLAARLASLQDAADALRTNGALGVATTSSNTAFSTTTSSTSVAGRYQIGVTKLATAAQARSQAFSSPTAAVKGGTLALNVQGTNYNITIGDGEALSDVALAIRQSGAPITATVLNDGTNSYLSLTNRNTGYPIGGTAGQALSATMTTTGSTGQALALATTVPADNAVFTVDGLSITRMSNTVSDAIPGTTLTLKALSPTGTSETLLLDYDSAATQANLHKFVDAYNHVMQLVQSQLDIKGTTDTTQTLAHDPAMRALQADMSNLVTTQVGTGTITSLADLGIETERDGSLSLDATKLANAMTQNPSAVNDIFQNATAGLGVATKAMVQQYTDPVSGVLNLDSQGINDEIGRMDNQISLMQVRVSAYHDMIAAQFTAMESLVSQMKSVGNFLTAQENAKK